jgi:hypothetical protein
LVFFKNFLMNFNIPLSPYVPCCSH